jgi:hypothetical protein
MSTSPLPDAPRRRPWRVVVLLALLAPFFISFALLSFATWRDTPDTPRAVTVSELSASTMNGAWVEVSDGQLDCSIVFKRELTTAVPIISRASSHFAVVELGPNDLCNAQVLPLRARIDGASSLARPIANRLAASGELVAAPALLRPIADPKGDAAVTAAGSSALLVAYAFAAGWIVRRRFGRPRRGAAAHAGLAGASSSMAIPAAGDVDAASLGINVTASDTVLPTGALALTEDAEQHGLAVRFVGMPVLLACGAGLAIAALGITIDIVRDQIAWRSGVEVAAEVSGLAKQFDGRMPLTTVTLTVASVVPGSREPIDESMIRRDRVWYTTWDPPDGTEKDVGRVVLDGDHITVEEKVEGWPFRLPNVILLLGCAAGLGAAARSAWRNSRRMQRLAVNVESLEVDLTVIEEQYVRGIHAGWLCKGVTQQAQPVEFRLDTAHPPARLIALDERGTKVLVVRERGGDGTLLPLFDDLAPFELSREQRARAQAVLAARGSRTKLA